MKKTLIALGISGCFAAPLANADTILGIYAGAGVWQSDLSGSIAETGTIEADLRDLGIQDQDVNFVYIALEHPVPVIPNIRLQMTDLAVDGSGALTTDFTLDGQTFSASSDVNSDIDLSHTDATLYYELLDNWITLDFGLTFRQFDGSIDVAAVSGPQAGTSVSEEFDETLPLVYLKGQFDLPLTGFYAGAAGNYIGYDGNDMTDYQLFAGWMSDGWVFDLGVEVGYRTFSLTLDDVADLDADLELDGAYASLNIHF
ncbi:TIGR04219 family outer membrane beta-barrel protein [Aurantivibrio plasticivorans]